MLEHELRALEVDWPPTPDLSGPVAQRLAETSQRAAPAPLVARLRPVWVLAALAGAALAAALAVPPVRAALARVLGLAGGERVERVERVPRGARLDLGRPATLAEARRRAGFRLGVPRRLGPPDAVRLGGDLAGGAISLLYGRDTVLTELPRATVVVAIKQVGPGVAVRQVDVAGARGFWIARGPRALLLPGANGRPAVRRAALPGAGVLLWDRNGVGYRLETRRPLAEALAIARSAR